MLLLLCIFHLWLKIRYGHDLFKVMAIMMFEKAVRGLYVV
jgi:hypothetical protein